MLLLTWDCSEVVLQRWAGKRPSTVTGYEWTQKFCVMQPMLVWVLQVYVTWTFPLSIKYPLLCLLNLPQCVLWFYGDKRKLKMHSNLIGKNMSVVNSVAINKAEVSFKPCRFLLVKLVILWDISEHEKNICREIFSSHTGNFRSRRFLLNLTWILIIMPCKENS